MGFPGATKQEQHSPNSRRLIILEFIERWKWTEYGNPVKHTDLFDPSMSVSDHSVVGLGHPVHYTEEGRKWRVIRLIKKR